MCATPGAVDREEVGQREAHLLRQVLDGRLRLPLLQLGVLVEQRRDQRGVDGHEDDAHHAQAGPHVVVEVGSPDANDPDNQGQHRDTQEECEADGHHLVLNEQAQGGLVKAVLLLDHEGTVQREGHGDHCIHQSQNDDKNPCDDNLLEEIRVVSA